MAIFISANKTSMKTTVSSDDIRTFVEQLNDSNEALKKARGELKKAVDGDEKIKELKATIESAKDVLNTYMQSHTVYKEYFSQIDKMTEEKKDLIDAAKDNGIPKKEIDTAIKMLKSDIDPDSTTEIYSAIADLVG